MSRRADRRILCIYTDSSDVTLDGAHWARLLAARTDDTITLRLRAFASKDNLLLSTPERKLIVGAPVSAGTLYYLDQTLAVAPCDDHTPVARRHPAPFPCRGHVRHLSRRQSWSSPRRRHAAAAQLAWLRPLVVHGGAARWSPRVHRMAFDSTARRIAYARAGALVLIDADDGTLLLVGDLPDERRVSHPDWSPDGRYLAVTLWPADAMPDEEALEGSSLARLPVAIDGTLGAPELLVASSKRDETLAFPVHSRDGAWLAYLQFKGKLRDGKEGKLWAVRSTGGEPSLRVVWA